MAQNTVSDKRSIKSERQVERREPSPQTGEGAWRRPHLERLRVSLDTAFEVGSATDGQMTGSL